MSQQEFAACDHPTAAALVALRGWVVVVYDREEAFAANGIPLGIESVRTRVHLTMKVCARSDGGG